MFDNVVNIVCTIDDAYAQHCGVMLRSLFANNPRTQFRVYILTSRLRRGSARRLGEVCKSCGHSLSISSVDVSILKDARVSGHVSLATYYRTLIPHCVPTDVDRALFLDSDVIVRGEIDQLYSQSLENVSHVAVAEASNIETTKRLGLARDSLYFNAGVLLLNLELWRREGISQQILDYIKVHSAHLVWWDQDALNAVLQNRWRRCAPTWNAHQGFFNNHSPLELNATDQEYREAKFNPRIVHFVGSTKPWDFYGAHPFRSEYYKYLAATPWKNYRPRNEPSMFSIIRRRIRKLAGGAACVFRRSTITKMKPTP